MNDEEKRVAGELPDMKANLRYIKLMENFISSEKDLFCDIFFQRVYRLELNTNKHSSLREGDRGKSPGSVAFTQFSKLLRGQIFFLYFLK